MKPRIFISAVIIIAVAAIIAGCPPKPQRLDDIVKDLSKESYSLSFENAMPEQGISQTQYGAESFLAFADPQDLICGDPIKSRYKAGIPVWSIPKIVRPTCPDMIPPGVATKLIDALKVADAAQFGNLKQINLQGGNVLLADEKFTSTYANIKPDMIDDSVLAGLDESKFIMLQMPGDMSGGFTRDFYGNANLNEIVFTKYKIDLPGILPPRLKGCFDPQVLTTIRDRLAMMNPDVYKGLQVSTLPQDQSIGVMPGGLSNEW